MTKYFQKNYAKMRLKHNVNYDGNLRGKNRNTRNYLYVAGSATNFNGFSGSSEFDSIPLKQLFINRHGRFPCEWDTGHLKSKDVDNYVKKNETRVLKIHYSLNAKSVNNAALYLGGKQEVYVYFYNRSYDGAKDMMSVCLLFLRKTKKVDKIIQSFIDLVIPEKKEEEGILNILARGHQGFYLSPINIKKPKIDFSVNYNSDFKDIHKLLVKELSVDNSKGLVLLHGGAGTGKTTYIRYLINVLKKKVIYIPPNMSEAISSPEMIEFFIKQSNSILVIEDAENILLKRASNSGQAISNILNLSDGLLSDCANIQIIATFNTDILNLDEALLRKGRLIAKYEFKELDKDRAEKLAKKLGVKISDNQTLTDIYNSEQKSFVEKPSKIGFSND